jgi:hypothetical protein
VAGGRPDCGSAGGQGRASGARTWEAWEGRRREAPAGLDAELREARSDAHLLLYVARARLRLGDLPLDLAPRLEAAARDPRLPRRRQLQAAEILAWIRMAALAARRTPTGPRDGPHAGQGGRGST